MGDDGEFLEEDQEFPVKSTQEEVYKYIFGGYEMSPHFYELISRYLKLYPSVGLFRLLRWHKLNNIKAELIEYCTEYVSQLISLTSDSRVIFERESLLELSGTLKSILVDIDYIKEYILWNFKNVSSLRIQSSTVSFIDIVDLNTFVSGISSSNDERYLINMQTFFKRENITEQNTTEQKELLDALAKLIKLRLGYVEKLSEFNKNSNKYIKLLEKYVVLPKRTEDKDDLAFQFLQPYAGPDLISARLKNLFSALVGNENPVNKQSINDIINQVINSIETTVGEGYPYFGRIDYLISQNFEVRGSTDNQHSNKLLEALENIADRGYTELIISGTLNDSGNIPYIISALEKIFIPIDFENLLNQYKDTFDSIEITYRGEHVPISDFIVLYRNTRDEQEKTKIRNFLINVLRSLIQEEK